MNYVECRSDTYYAERPVALTWNGERDIVTGVLYRWRDELGRGFRVRTFTDRLFDLHYDECQDTWQVKLLS